MLTAFVLTVLAVLFRVFSATYQVWNFAPMAAISLYAGSRLPRRWAWVVPVVAMVVSDLLLDQGRYRPAFELTRWTIYTTFAVTTLLGPLANWPRFGRWLLPILSVTGSLLFFVTSNLATWGEGLLYPMTFTGLIACFVAAIPFFGNTIAADLIGTAALFGLGPVFERAARSVTGRRTAAVAQEITPSESRAA
ncbi:MAG TPA: DUF6580 family putative transport protein [Isosphaeraceae bacterium]|jgi:hypothetical protein|nr:DUF6580 family putative transport protein [Isosphaeraceae bacterium]